MSDNEKPISERIDLTKLTLGEIANIEDIAGQGIKTLSNPDKPVARLLMGIALILGRRKDQTYTMAQASNVTLEEIEEILGGDDDDESVIIDGDDDSPKGESESAPQTSPFS